MAPVRQFSKQALTLLLSANLMLTSCATGGGAPDDEDELVLNQEGPVNDGDYESESVMQKFATSVAMPVVFTVGFIGAMGLMFWGVTHIGQE